MKYLINCKIVLITGTDKNKIEELSSKLMEENDYELLLHPYATEHPTVQVEKMKELLLIDKNYLIISNSDHVINIIRVMVKEKYISSTDVIIYHINDEIDKIEIDRKGELSEYPRNFLNVWSDLLLKLLNRNTKNR